jgi:hypothetical protein
MTVVDRIREWFRGGRSSAEWIPFLDVSGRIIQIPASAVRPGMIQVRVGAREELVWTLAENLEESKEVRHPPFDEDVRKYIRDIRETFLEHRPISFDEWEDGFRRDKNALQEIAIWSHAAGVYRVFGANDVSPERRKEVYRVIVTCLSATPHAVWQVLDLKVLSRREAQRIVRRFYGKHA